ncbi:hypothetical protein [Parasulfitobacter algicola]|uniref:Uncharacterized protein n=1 Tax=Parasulfitobacter algicola TaxID=2614809 RepID=A0ABX2IND3_9RHOB|nr:hypothetical protein [Sulfitobacter algicola]NSX53471.1 hypothetical protein [Sulfitobacter algicola]
MNLNGHQLTAEDILNMPEGEVHEFMRNKIATHKLSPIIKSLNISALSADQNEKMLAKKALQHLGFADQ